MQELIVGLIVCIAATFVAKQYGPRRVKLAIADGQVWILRRLRLHKQAARLYQKSHGCHSGAVTLESLKRSLPRRPRA